MLLGIFKKRIGFMVFVLMFLTESCFALGVPSLFMQAGITPYEVFLLKNFREGENIFVKVKGIYFEEIEGVKTEKQFEYVAAKLPREILLRSFSQKNILDKVKEKSEKYRWVFEFSHVGHIEDSPDHGDEFLDILDDNGVIKGKALRKKDVCDLPHVLGLRHRTTNAFVYDPETGRFIFQRRSYLQDKDQKIGIAGGHISHDPKIPQEQAYREGVSREVCEEFNYKSLPGLKLKGNFYRIGEDGFFRSPEEDVRKGNIENRSFYVYVPSPEELAFIKKEKRKLDEIKSRMTESEFRAFFQREKDEHREGSGEVQGIYFLNIDTLFNDFSEKGTIKIKNRFAGQEEVEEEVKISSGLLGVCLKDRKIRSRLRLFHLFRNGFVPPLGSAFMGDYNLVDVSAYNVEHFRLFYEKGLIFKQERNYLRAIECFDRALQYAGEERESLQVIVEKAELYRYLHDYITSIRCSLNALRGLDNEKDALANQLMENIISIYRDCPIREREKIIGILRDFGFVLLDEKIKNFLLSKFIDLDILVETRTYPTELLYPVGYVVQILQVSLPVENGVVNFYAKGEKDVVAVLNKQGKKEIVDIEISERGATKGRIRSVIESLPNKDWKVTLVEREGKKVLSIKLTGLVGGGCGASSLRQQGEAKLATANTIEDYDQIIYFFSAEIGHIAQSNPEYFQLKDILGDAYYRRGLKYKKVGNYHAAIADFDRALQHSRHISSQAKFYNDRAEAYRKLGNVTAAQADLAKAAEISEEDRITVEEREAERRAENATPYADSRDCEENEDITYDPHCPHGWYDHGECPTCSQNSLSPLNYTPALRAQEEKLVIPELKIKRTAGVISEIVFDGRVYADIEQIPCPEARNYARLYLAADRAGLLERKADFIYVFKFYENTPSLGRTINLTPNSAVIEINRKMLKDENFRASLARIMEVIKKEDLRTEQNLLARVNAMLVAFGQGAKQLRGTMEEIKANKELNDKFEALVRILSYKEFSEKFVELSAEVHAAVNWEEYRRSLDYLYKAANLLMDDNPELRQQLSIAEPFNFYKQDMDLVNVLVQPNGVKNLVELYFDNIIRESALRMAA